MSAEKSLEALRREIDAIDDAIHDLIMKRTQVVERVRDVKRNDAVKIRPAREAEILYRLVARHQGHFPKRELVRMWREIIVATLSFEGPFSLAVYAPDEGCDYRDLARDQYGSFTPATPHVSVRRVIEAVGRGEATVGILPVPTQGDQDPWWRHLVSTGPEVPRVIARLPFTGPGRERRTRPEALVIAGAAPAPTGRDRWFLAVDAERRIGLNQIGAALADAGLPPVFSALWHEPLEPGVWLYLAEVEDYVGGEDGRIGIFLDALGKPVNRVVPLGGYAVPFTEGELNR